MAQPRWSRISDTAEGLCYLYATVACLLFAITCFAIASTYSSFMPVGITLFLFAVLFFVLFMWRRKRRHPRDGDDGGSSGFCCCCACCACCCSPSVDSRCDHCLVKMLCLPSFTQEERDAEAQARLSAIISAGDPAVQVTPHTVGCTSRAARWPQLRSLQKVIQNLQREYEYLERYPDILPMLEECYMSLLHQEETLAMWMSGRDTPSHEDVKAMKSMLTQIKREMRQALTIAETNNLPRSPHALPTISERVNLSAVAGPQPPPYTVDDPLQEYSSLSISSSTHTDSSLHQLPPPSAFADSEIQLAVSETNRQNTREVGRRGRRSTRETDDQYVTTLPVEGYITQGSVSDNHNVPAGIISSENNTRSTREVGRIGRRHQRSRSRSRRRASDDEYVDVPVEGLRTAGTLLAYDRHNALGLTGEEHIEYYAPDNHNVPAFRIYNGYNMDSGASSGIEGEDFDQSAPADETGAPPSYEEAVSSTV